MVAQDTQGGKIIMVGSTLGYLAFVGYSSYCPAKYALRGRTCMKHDALCDAWAVKTFREMESNWGLRLIGFV